MIRAVDEVMNSIFSAVLNPLSGFDAWWGMLVISLASSLLLLLVFKFVSNRRAIRKTRNRAIARVLELLLFKDDVVVNLGALGRVLWANLLYMGSLLKPMLVSMIPFVLILIQVSVWFGSRPLRTGETALLKVKLTGNNGVIQQDISLSTSAGVEVETRAVRIPSRNEVAWRLVARNDGQQWAGITVGGREERKGVAVGERLAAVSNVRVRTGSWRALMYPVEPPLAPDGPIEWIAISHPGAEFTLGGMRLHWLVVYFVLTLVIAWLLKGPLKVEI